MVIMGVWESQQGVIPKQDEMVNKRLTEGHKVDYRIK